MTINSHEAWRNHARQSWAEGTTERPGTIAASELSRYHQITEDEAARLEAGAAWFAANGHIWETAGTISAGVVTLTCSVHGYQGYSPACSQCVRDEDAARADAEADFTAACERTVAAGQCTGCEEDAAELIPWTPRERLCWRCTDFQLDLLALAMGEAWSTEVTA